jgi:toxin-antitoxin system PIN domain toxin
MRHLCDSNVFVALAIDSHSHHSTALKWFDSLSQGDSAAFCRMTQNTFLRIITTDEVMRPYTLTNAQALSVYRTMLKDARINFASEPAGIEETWLSAAAMARMSPKLTFDKAFRQFRDLDLLLL